MNLSDKRIAKKVHYTDPWRSSEIPANDEVFEVLRTKCKELSEWLAENFNPYTKIVITPTLVTIEEEVYGQPIGIEH